MSNDMNENDKLKSLAQEAVPGPSATARQRAMIAAMEAFDAAQSEQAEKIQHAPQGNAWGQRLISIVRTFKGNWTMDMRLSLGTAALVLLALPIGYQLYTTTALTPFSGKGSAPVEVLPPAPVADKKEADSPQTEGRTEEMAVTKPASVPADAPKEAEAPVMSQTAPEPMAVERLKQDAASSTSTPSGTMVPMQEAAPMMDSEDAADLAVGGAMAQRAQSIEAFAPSPAPMVAGGAMQPMSPSVVAPVDSGDTFAKFDESPLKLVSEAPVSTFSIDVDTASYSYVRSMLSDGYVPEPDAVRIEEMVNYFPYAYAAPQTADMPFKPSMSIYPTPWNPKTQLLHIGIKGYVPEVTEDKPSNLVFLFDTSGSMDEPNKLPLLKRAFALLVENLSANDTVSIVAYAGSAGVVLEPTKASDKAKILSALDGLAAGGSTAGGEGIAMAYKLAEANKIADGVNRVILATDGDFNVGIDDPDELEDYIKTQRDKGVFLSVLGFGRGNLDDALMQSLAQNGNGNAAYIDSFKEAQKVLVAEGGSTLETIAKDVKIQVEFNPAFVSEYRLIGYETRALNREDFNNDKVDAGDIGAGHTVTAIYEITPKGAESVDALRYGNAAAPAGGGEELGYLKLRYKLPNEDTSQLIEMPIGRDLVVDDIAKTSDDDRFATAVAAFGQKLKGSAYGDMSWGAIRDLAQGARGKDELGYRAEFVQLVDLAKGLVPDEGANR
jgi:Ca-activated chloride channel family protein